MNTRFLASFCAVVEAGSLAAAARRLNLASASVAEQVAALERELRARLLVRHGRSLVPTEAGRAVLGLAGEMLARVEEMRHAAQLGQPSGQLRVGSISTALISLMPPALRRMAERHPGVEIKVVPGTSAQLHQRLERGELDCVLAVRPPFALPKSLAWHRLRREALTLIAPAGLEGESVAALLGAAPLIRADRESWSGRLVTDYLRDHRLAVRELFELDAQEAIVILVAQGLGVALLPDWGIEAPSGRALRRLPVPEPRYAREVGMLVGRGRRESLAALLTDSLREGAAEQEAPPPG
ncbi:LysR substrate-binding domain-containing protein [Teichococcus cervicalis]|uniref:LysR substrate binding domain protein n=1 Tax=Pseudoroseomonas cervicalis ATCC 49957 TaxID=525371 RepID=D5RJU5_9PROT|nr:LysR substrate-binding domain-containing protein [Pseudoroseomonas cervicalis]EFH12424.1 LysR substrate binding domain protein [Pseudoroseomonas cervicalis ATCC 49957]